MKSYTSKDVDFAIKLLICREKREKAMKTYKLAALVFSIAVFLLLLFKFDFDVMRTITIYFVYLIIFSSVYFGVRGIVIHSTSRYEKANNAKILGGYMFGKTYSDSFEISLADFIGLTKYDFIQLGVKSDYDTEYLDSKKIAEKEISEVKHTYKKFIF